MFPLCACVPLVPPAQLALPVTHPLPDANAAIDSARRAFTRAAQSGDVQGMARFFTEDGMVITAEGDTVRGQEALAEFFATERAGPTTAVLHFGRFSRESMLQSCSNGVNERGRFRASPTLSGPYAVRWQWDSLGAARIQRINFVTRSAVRRLGPSGCYIPLIVRQRSKRIVVSLFGATASASAPGHWIESAMRQHGWADGGEFHYVCPSWGNCLYHTTPWTHQAAARSVYLSLGIVSLRFSPHWATELVFGDRPRGSTIGLDSAGTTQLEAIWTGSFVGTAVTYQRYGLQVGLGPAVEKTQWRMVRANPFNVSLRSETSGRAQALGLILDAGFHIALLGPFRFDARAQLRGFSKTNLPGGTTYLNAPVADNSAFIAAGMGMVF